MLKHITMGAFGLVLLSGAAIAADLPSRAAPPVFVPPPPVPVFTWTGFYIGVNGGYGFGGSSLGSYTSSNYYGGGGAVDAKKVTTSSDESLGGIGYGYGYDSTTSLGGSKLNGGFGGGQIGYNYQFNQIVVGVEADGEGSGIGASSSVSPYYDPYYSIVTRNRIGVFGSVRGRIGVAFDRFLVYATGGYAYADIHTSQGVSYDGAYYGTSAHTSGLKSGYAVGGGVEYAFSNNWTVKGEYQYLDFGSRSLTSQPYYGDESDYGYSSYGHMRTHFNTVRVGLNYKFDSFAPAPVVARY